MRAQSGRYGFLVYIFRGDAERMKQSPDRKWNLYGLWTHSSSPVVQYMCDEKQDDQSVQNLGLELLGQCLPQSNRVGQGVAQPRSRNGRWLVVHNDGRELEAVLVKRGDLAPVGCSVKVLPMESPFSNFKSHRPRDYREPSPERRPRAVQPERTVPTDKLSERKSRSPPTDNTQWYTTSRGEELLRSIHSSCISSFPRPSAVEMSRDSVDHNMQLSIKHRDKTYSIYFPSNFPQSPADVFKSAAIYGTSNMRLGQVTSKEDIVRNIKNHCRCYECRR